MVGEVKNQFIPESVTATEINAWHLPSVLRQIAEIIGIDGALKLVDAYGGTRLYIPKRISEDHPLANLLGMSSATDLSHHFGGLEHFDIPKAIVAKCALRNARIRADRRAGEKKSALARRYDLTERQIHNIVK